MNQKKFIELVGKSLNVEISKINMNLKLGDIEEWDSLGHLSILTSLDKVTKGKSSKIPGLGTKESLKKIWKKLEDNKLTK
jgi:hypothetical protein